MSARPNGSLGQGYYETCLAVPGIHVLCRQADVHGPGSARHDVCGESTVGLDRNEGRNRRIIRGLCWAAWCSSYFPVPLRGRLPRQRQHHANAIVASETLRGTAIGDGRSVIAVGRNRCRLTDGIGSRLATLTKGMKAGRLQGARNVSLHMRPRQSADPRRRA